MTQYDTVYYWTGGRVYGKWNRTLGYKPEMLSDLAKAGYVAHPGKLSIGAPEGPPKDSEFRALGL